MKSKQLKIVTFVSILLIIIALPYVIPEKSSGEEERVSKLHQERQTSVQPIDEEKEHQRFTFESGYHFEYPDAVRGIYVTGHSAGGSRFDTLLELIGKTDLNSMVIDIKDDHGYLTFEPGEDSPFEDISQKYIHDPENMMRVLEENEIYPIARIVVFKDTVLAKKRPDLSFTEDGEVWINGRGEAFVSPFQKEVWEYNVEIAKLAAQMGFKEIQFDYVRFPEGFEHRDEILEYTQGDYADSELDNIKRRVEAVTNFVTYAKKELESYDVDVSVDIFGYSATIEEAPGIGQNFSRISENVDVISSMIYPSHWTNNYFDIPIPDKEPYRLTDEYAKVENEVLGKLENRPVSRPWIQDFEAPWIYSGTGVSVQQYGKEEVEAQIRALQDNGINEFLIWNAGNTYTENVDYTP
ncbi:GTP-binding protein [Ornithinibacillus sp. L9]|uniref:GTP-binding protein n=1 Tax=Ornithinibacillus caprae TaxID=2678566 RepID=A0A6N8FQZ5_9BACI|nr:putative glycoside hydrolase [Ornithinibacillus caprae]MUK90579.1 GTP-binding protein [Ornithinibacillus caprae]